ncbi:hypothetical protein D7X33_10095 [Butyricicoccus sp. 1XD8-22]|nr:hypothetical protein D7X33_10095 [Butyricicoccus sp. 1XD8-22]
MRSASFAVNLTAALAQPAGGMKFLLDFFSKKSRGAGAEPRRPPRRRGTQERRAGQSAQAR